MVINGANLRGIYQAYNIVFNKAFSEVKPLYEQIATVVPSTTDTETYAWLGDIQGMREWIGNREINNLSGSDYSIKNKSFESTVGIPVNAIEDDKLGLYRPSVEMLAQGAAMHPDSLVFGLLQKGFTEKCFDGKAFFAEDHAVKGKGKGKKDVSYSNKGTAKLTMDSYCAARASMMSIKNGAGISLNLIPNLLVVPPALEKSANDIVVADLVNGTRNSMAGTAKVLVASQLTSDTAWYLLCTARPVKPLIYQERKKPKFVSKTRPDDDNVFFDNQYLYGVDCRGNAGYGFWQMAYGSTGEAEPQAQG